MGAEEDREWVELVILAGQSNMAGRGHADDIPQDLIAPEPRVRYHYTCTLGADRNIDPKAGPHRSSGWVALQPCPKHPSTPGDHFGPEISVGPTLLELWPGSSLGLLKHGRGGTSLHTDWQPRSTRPGGLYRQLLDQLESAKAQLRDLGRRPRIRAVLWYQGEADAARPETAAAYADHFRDLIAALRADTATPGLTFVAARFGPGGGVNPKNGAPVMPHATAVRQAIETVTGADPHADWVDTDDLPLSDAVHLASEGVIEVGRRMARSLARLVKLTG